MQLTFGITFTVKNTINAFTVVTHQVCVSADQHPLNIPTLAALSAKQIHCVSLNSHLSQIYAISDIIII